MQMPRIVWNEMVHTTFELDDIADLLGIVDVNRWIDEV